MSYEYEYKYKDFDKKDIVKKLKDLGATYDGTFIFRVQIFKHPTKKQNTYIRIRDEKHRITMTYKYRENNSDFQIEHEVNINNFDEGCEILLGVGCEKHFYYEKIREIWTIKNTEICFDTYVCMPDIMEVESKTKSELEKYVKLLGLTDIPHNNFRNADLYKDNFGIVIPSNINNLTFLNSKKTLEPYCTKNKTEFSKLVDKQKKTYLSLIKKKN